MRYAQRTLTSVIPTGEGGFDQSIRRDVVEERPEALPDGTCSSHYLDDLISAVLAYQILQHMHVETNVQ